MVGKQIECGVGWLRVREEGMEQVMERWKEGGKVQIRGKSAGSRVGNGKWRRRLGSR